MNKKKKDYIRPILQETATHISACVQSRKFFLWRNIQNIFRDFFSYSRKFSFFLLLFLTRAFAWNQTGKFYIGCPRVCHLSEYWGIKAPFRALCDSTRGFRGGRVLNWSPMMPRRTQVSRTATRLIGVVFPAWTQKFACEFWRANESLSRSVWNLYKAYSRPRDWRLFRFMGA